MRCAHRLQAARAVRLAATLGPLAALVLLVASAVTSEVHAEAAYKIYYYGATPSGTSSLVPARSPFEVCTQIMPAMYNAAYPQQGPFTNGRFVRWLPGATEGRYAYQFWSFECHVDRPGGTPDERWNVGQVQCEGGDNPNARYVDYVGQRCLCDPRYFVTAGDICVHPSQTTCPLVVDGVCHGGKTNGRCGVGNPCDPATGNKYQREVLISTAGELAFALAYNTFDDLIGRTGRRWRDSFNQTIQAEADRVIALRADGKALRFARAGSDWQADADIIERLTELKDAQGTRLGWTLISAAEESETYDARGVLTSIRNRRGEVRTFHYSDGGSGGPAGGVFLGDDGQPTAHALPAGWLTRVSDAYGRTIGLAYDLSARIVRVMDPAGAAYGLAYDAFGNLTSVTYLDGRARMYHYNEPEHTGGANLPHALTGLTDENGVRFATYQYDAQGRAISTAHADGAERFTLAYGAGQTVVTDPLGTARIYTFQTILGVAKNTAISQPCIGAACAAGAAASTTYDANGNVTTRTDWNGIVTAYNHDLARNLETRRIDAQGTTEERTVTTEWHPSLRVPKRIAEPKRLTTLFYNGLDGFACGNDAQGVPIAGLVCQRQVEATDDANGAQGFAAAVVGNARIWRYTYNSAGQVRVINGPREDLNDRVYFTYDAQGNLASVRNALGHITTLGDYDAHGRPGRVTDPNGLVTTLGYTPRGWLASRTAGGLTITYDYDGVGQLTRITFPDGTQLKYTYDAAHRLVQIGDGLGNKIVYTLDALGNRLKEDTYDPAGALKTARARVYDALNRLLQDIGGTDPATQITEYASDNQGNRLSSDGPLAGTQDLRTYAYDALGRLVQAIDPIGGITRTSFDALDQVATVTDPRGLVTTYTIDGLGNTTRERSPDRGLTTLQYTSAGQVKRRTDARGQTTTYTYDALNRLTVQAFADGSAVTYTYDQGANAIGRLSSASFPGGQTIYGYDAHGRLASRQDQHTDGPTLGVSYQYDATSGRLASIVYPSGKRVALGHDAAGRISALSIGATPIAQAIGYLPFGRPNTWTWGNGQRMSEPHDLDGRPTAIRLRSGHSRNIRYDAAGRLKRYSHSSDATAEQEFSYDRLDRLIGWTTPSASRSYAYDANGNRKRLTIGADTYAYTTPANSNRLAATAGPLPIRSFSYDKAGNVIGDGIATWIYNARGRMASATVGTSTVTYTHDGRGQRVKKSGPAGTIHFVYDEQGRLLGEYDAGGTVIQEYIYLAGELLAIVRGTTDQPEVFYVYTDPVGRVWTVTDTQNRFRWRWDTSPFGESAPDENPNGLGAFKLNVRSPGQYYDAETGLFYNYFRDYDPQTGRYVQVDPIGLAGGINTYAYANLNPMSDVDVFGLAPGDPYPSADSAAIQAIKDINPTSIKENLEYAGQIYRNPDGTYSYTAPLKGTESSSDVGPIPTGKMPAGDYHTHGGPDPRYDNENFSPGDMRAYDRLGTPGYLGTPSGAIKKYIPNSSLPGKGKIWTLKRREPACP